MATKHTVLFVGRFDPPHINHVRAASALMRRSDVESVWVFPLAGPYESSAEHVRNMCTIWCADMSLGGEKPTCCTAGLDKGLQTASEAWAWMRMRFPTLNFKLAMFENEFDFAEDCHDGHALWSSYTVKVGAGRVTANLGPGFVVLNFPPVPRDLEERIIGGSNESRNFIAPVWDYLQKHRLYRNGGRK